MGHKSKRMGAIERLSSRPRRLLKNTPPLGRGCVSCLLRLQVLPNFGIGPRRRVVALAAPLFALTCWLEACDYADNEKADDEASDLAGLGGALGGAENGNDAPEKPPEKRSGTQKEEASVQKNKAPTSDCSQDCGRENRSPSCDDTECSISCEEGFLDCDGDVANGCELQATGEPSTPRLLQPTIGTFTGSLHAASVLHSLRPTFSWRHVSAQACGDLTYELQADDSCELSNFAACSFESPEVQSETSETTFTPAEDLPVRTEVPVGSRYYWRVRSCEGGVGCSAWSEVRYLDVGRDMQDVTGDGYADLILQSRDDSYAILAGGPDFGTGGSTKEDRLFLEGGNAGSHEDNAATLRFVGDVDGDGFNDFAASGDGGETHLGGGDYPDGTPTYLDLERYVFFGASDVDDIVALPFFIKKWGYGLAPTNAAGDFNRDGYADLVSSKSVVFSDTGADYAKQTPAAYLLWGGPTAREGLSIAKEILPPTGQNHDYFASASDFGDFNGDGLVDLVLVAPSEPSAVIVSGGKDDSVELDLVIPQGGEEATEYSCRDGRIAVGDLNQDGFDDFAITCQGLGMIQVYLGSSALPATFEATMIVPSALSGHHSVYDVAIGDLSGDGYPDVVTSEGVVYLGGEEIADEPTRLSSDLAESYFAVGDHNGDGHADLALIPRSSSSQSLWLAGGSLVAEAHSDPGLTSHTTILTVDDENPGRAVAR